MLGSFDVSEEFDYIEFFDGWSDFTEDAGIQIDDLLIIQVKVTPYSIKLIVEVVPGPAELASYDSSDDDNDEEDHDGDDNDNHEEDHGGDDNDDAASVGSSTTVVDQNFLRNDQMKNMNLLLCPCIYN